MVLLTNAVAGRYDDGVVRHAAGRLGGRYGVEVRATTSADELEQAVPKHTSVVVVAGGDGTLHSLVNMLHRTGRLATVTLGLVPLGTGNDFARGLGIPLDIEGAVDRLLAAQPRPVDLMVDGSGEVVVNGVHLGIGAEAARAAGPFKRVLGRLGYAVGALVGVATHQPLQVEVRVDETVVAHRGERLAQVAVANGPAVGGGAELAPGASPYDGELDVLVSRAVSPLARARYAVQLKLGTHPRRADTTELRGRRVSVRGAEFLVSADGETSGPHTEQSWQVMPGATSILA
jgi:diacylglycerol kinase (ATP)